MAKARYDSKTQDAIDDYKVGTRIRNGQLTVREKVQLPNLVISPNARAGYGSYLQGEAERKLREINPGLSDHGVKQTLHISDADQPEVNWTNQQLGNVDVEGSFKRGGVVKKTGIYKLHKGERVLTKKQNKRLPPAFYGK